MIIQLGNFGGGGGGSVDPSVLSGYCNGGQYNASTQKIELLHDSNVIARIDASAFVIDGMVEDVYLSGTTLVIEFNTAAGKQNIEVPLSSIFDPSNYYTKTDVDAIASGKADTSALSAYTQDVNFTAHSGNTSMHTTVEEKAAWNAKQDASAMTEYYTSAQTQSAISGAVLTKQDTLISGQNIKTINNESLLGSGNITISGGGSSNIVELTQAEYDALATKDPDTLYIITDAQAINLSGYAQTSAVTAEIAAAVSGKADASAVTQSLSSKQDVLVSGTNIKTINNQSLLGSGNINISGGSGSYVYYSEDTEAKSATIHIEDAENGTTGEVSVYSDGGSMDASGTDSETNYTYSSSVNNNPYGAEVSYDKNTDDPADEAHSYLNVQEGNISMEVYADYNTTQFAVSNNAVTINGENVVTEGQLADYQPLLSAGTGIDITNNVISATGGGGATYSAGTNISIDTANTINCILNLENGTGSNSIKMKDANNASGTDSFAIGSSGVKAEGVASFAGGSYSEVKQPFSMAFGRYVKSNNYGEVSFGFFNQTNGSSSAQGNSSGNTLFSVGNGTGASARHNAFEIRQNGDIYVNDGTNDVKLQDTIIGTAANTTALGGLKFVRCTQAQYDAMVSGGTIDSDTMYIIVSGS